MPLQSLNDAPNFHTVDTFICYGSLTWEFKTRVTARSHRAMRLAESRLKGTYSKDSSADINVQMHFSVQDGLQRYSPKDFFTCWPFCWERIFTEHPSAHWNTSTPVWMSPQSTEGTNTTMTWEVVRAEALAMLLHWREEEGCITLHDTALGREEVPQPTKYPAFHIPVDPVACSFSLLREVSPAIATSSY